MNSADAVDMMIKDWKKEGLSKSEIVWNTALACIGWPYKFGRKGQIVTRDGMKVRWFDCWGFVYWCLMQVGIELKGAGCTSGWNSSSNWEAKGSKIKEIPKGRLVCLFYKEKDGSGKMAHTGFGLNGETCECSEGVQYFSKMKSKWTHWAIPKGLDGVIPFDPTKRPLLQKGDKGEYVTLAQTKLLQKGYDLGKWGIDGDFGSATEKAVKQFQQDHGLKVDGIIGDSTWNALDEQGTNLYTVNIPHLPKFKAEALIKQYSGSSMIEERG